MITIKPTGKDIANGLKGFVEKSCSNIILNINVNKEGA